MKNLFWIILSFICLVGCRHESLVNNDLFDTNNPMIDSTGCDDQTVYFINDIQPLLSSSCAISGCHDENTAQDGVVLTSYENVVITGDVEAGDPTHSEIYEVLVETDPDKKMPPASSAILLTNAQIQLVYTWIENGALYNGCIDTTLCDTINRRFSTDVFPVLQTHCVGCHSGASPQGGISLSNYTEVKVRVDDGSLFGSINHDVGFSAMPKNQAKLSDCVVDQIKSWINAGALDN